MIFAVVFSLGVAAVIAVIYVQLLERAEARRLARVFFTDPTTTRDRVRLAKVQTVRDVLRGRRR